MKQQNWEKEFDKIAPVKLEIEGYICDLRPVITPLKKLFKKALAQQKEELLLEGEKSMAKGVLRRIAKGRSLEHIKVLCEAVLKEKL